MRIAFYVSGEESGGVGRDGKRSRSAAADFGRRGRLERSEVGLDDCGSRAWAGMGT